jgi:glycosyltransferase involved in cell wall biosynthesis
LETHAVSLSVGLAVYNGERYLREAIDSILSQTYKDFELIISDNASTDATETICQAYAAQDCRIRYSRNATNIGGVNNQNRTFDLARGRYFRLAAHDDVCAPTLFQRCVEVLEERPEIVLCYSGMYSIDGHGKITEERVGTEGTASRPSERFRQLSYRYYPCDAMYGVLRSDILRTTALQQNYTGSDRSLLCELALRGPFHVVPEPLFYKRFHEGNRYKDWRGRMAWFDPGLSNTGRPTFPNWLQVFDYVRLIRRARVSPTERLRCSAWLLVRAGAQAKGLVRDLATASYMLMHSKEWRRRRYADEHRWL